MSEAGITQFFENLNQTALWYRVLEVVLGAYLVYLALMSRENRFITNFTIAPVA